MKLIFGQVQVQALTDFDTKPYRIEFGTLSMMDEETVLL